MTLKPGILCYLVNLHRNEQDAGRVVTTVRVDEGYWEVTAEWLLTEPRDCPPPFWAAPYQLLPISDPDERATTNTRERLTA